MTAQTLFSVNEIVTQPAKPKEKSKVSATVAKKKEAQRGKRRQKVKDVVGTITQGTTLHYVSAGEWSMHDLLFHLLEQTGPAHVYTASWSVTEDPCRQIVDRIATGKILSFSALFDWRVKVRAPAVFGLAKANYSDVRLGNCHAKVTVIQNDTWAIAIVGSANYTNNPRIEAGVIDCSADAANFHVGWISEQMAGADPFEM